MSSPMSKKFSHGIIECPICHKEFKSLGIGRHRAKCYKEWQKTRYSPMPVPIQVSVRWRPDPTKDELK